MKLTRALVTAAVCALPACMGDPSGSDEGQVRIAEDFFTPNPISPAPDGTVTWVWVGAEAHNVVFEDGVAGSLTMVSGSYARDFSGENPGTYRYRCEHHSSDFTSGMVGEVMVP